MFKKGGFLISLLVCCFGYADLPVESTPSQGIVYTQNDLEHVISHYSLDEQRAIRKDLALVKEMCFDQRTPQKDTPIYLATAGAPGAHKSTILEHLLNKEERFANMVYLDPDQRALKWMVHTYYSRSLTANELSLIPNYAAVQKQAYDKWRSASNFIANSILEAALKGRYKVAHGTTMTGFFASRLLTLVKTQGYYIVLALCSCEDTMRKESIKYRDEVQGFYQTDPNDVIEKGRLFPKRMPVYFSQADELLLFWSDRFDSNERLAAVLSPQGLKVVDKEAYDRFIDKYERDRAQLQVEEDLELPKWEQLIASWKTLPPKK